MPEIKNTFTQGKMNKDLDERIVPNGQYRDATNIQVSTSDGSDIGTVQNILGNTEIGSLSLPNNSSTWECVGSIADEKNDVLYSFITDDINSAIVEYAKDETVTPVLVDIGNNTLKFSTSDIITGINIIDEFLLWTDGSSEPKKINIQRCKDGTFNLKAHTRLDPIVITKTTTAGGTGGGVNTLNLTGIGTAADPNVKVGDRLIYFETDIMRTIHTPSSGIFVAAIDYATGDVTFDQYFHMGGSASQFDVNWVHVFGTSTVLVEEYITVIKKKPLRSLSVKINPADPSDKKPLFEKIFPRFSYRYRYIDGEYSSLAPFTDVVFNSLYPEVSEDIATGMPTSYNEKTAYAVKEPYNKGMRNMIESIELYDFVSPNIPKDVVQVDLLYKQENSSVVYVMEVIKNTDAEWSEDGINGSISGYRGKFEVKSENIYAALPTNQLLRPWDNIPKVAKAQEITGNRLVYGNYKQGYDIDISPKIVSNHQLRHPTITPPYSGGGLPSVKSQRNYQLGVVYGDKYGRETPVFTSSESSVVIPWEDNASLTSGGVNHPLATFSLQLKTHLESAHPSWADYYKFFVKETSGEYYNLVMDTMWTVTKPDLENDEHIWISFASSDRNKISKDDYIILKKRVTKSTQVETENKFRVLDVKNEAPDAIKYIYYNLGERTNTVPTAVGEGRLMDLFDSPSYTIMAVSGSSTSLDIVIDKTDWLSFGGGPLMHDDKPLPNPIYLSWTKVITAGNNEHSKKYKVVSIRESGAGANAKYNLKLEKKVSAADQALAEDDTYADTIDGAVIFRIQEKRKRDLESFSGRFFVKILANSLTRDVLLDITGSVLNQQSNITVTTGGEGDVFYLANKNETGSYIESNGLINNSGKGSNAKNVADDVTTTEAAWATILSNMSGSSNFFIDKMHMAAVQTGLYAKHATYGLNAGNPNDIGDTFGHDGGNNPAHPPFPASGTYRQRGHGNFKSLWYPANNEIKPQNPTSNPALAFNHGDQLINGLEGIVTTNSNHVGPGGLRRWRDVTWGDGYTPFNWDTSSTLNTTVYHSGGQTYLHISYLAPGEDLHDGNFKFTNANLRINSTNSDNQEEDSLLHNNLQGIHGGGVFTSATTTYTGNNWTGNNKDVYMELLPIYGWSGSSINNNPTGTSGIALNVNNKNKIGGFDRAYRAKHDTQWDLPQTDRNFIEQFTAGTKFIFEGDTTVYTVADSNVTQPRKLYNHTPWRKMWKKQGSGVVGMGNSVEEAAADWADSTDGDGANGDPNKVNILKERIENFGKANNRRVSYMIMIDADPTVGGTTYDPLTNITAEAENGIQIVTNVYDSSTSGYVSGTIAEFPAIWETEPKDNVDLDIYYETNQAYPTTLTLENIELFAQVGSEIEFDLSGATTGASIGAINDPIKLKEWISTDTFTIEISPTQPGVNTYTGSIAPTMLDYVGTRVKFVKPNGGFTEGVISASPTKTIAGALYLVYDTFTITPTTKTGLSWYNCLTFGNGIESDRIRDDFNAMTLSNGVNASSTLDKPYAEEHRKSGLIYSGIYNSTSGVNNLNQFIAAEKITKDLNPTYGSIQKLFSRRISLIAFCEDRVVGITSNKNALYNADGKPQIVASDAVLGDANPFVGDYGISKDPESFAKESYRAYFTDRQRGAVLRLSMDGLTPISDAGMRDWFRDNLKDGNSLVGTYDSHKKDYNITVDYDNLGGLVSNPGFEEGEDYNQYKLIDVELAENVIFKSNPGWVDIINNGNFDTSDYWDFTGGTANGSVWYNDNSDPQQDNGYYIFYNDGAGGTAQGQHFYQDISDGKHLVEDDVVDISFSLTQVDVNASVLPGNDPNTAPLIIWGDATYSSSRIKVIVYGSDGSGAVIKHTDIRTQPGGTAAFFNDDFIFSKTLTVADGTSDSTKFNTIRFVILGIEAEHCFGIDNVELKYSGYITDNWKLNSFVDNSSGNMNFLDGGTATQTGALAHVIDSHKQYRIQLNLVEVAGSSATVSINGLDINVDNSTLNTNYTVTHDVFFPNSGALVIRVVGGGIGINSMSLKELDLYGGAVTDWDMNGSGGSIDETNIYAFISLGDGRIVFEDAPIGTYLNQETPITNRTLDFNNGAGIKVSFNLDKYRGSGDLKFYLYNADGEGFEHVITMSDGNKYFTGTIGTATKLDSTDPKVGKFGFEVTSEYVFSGDIDSVDLVITSQGSGTTVSYSEDVKGWTSFKSFIPESGVSMSGDYYTFDQGKCYKHHSNQTRNNFYGSQASSDITFLLNESPTTIKNFNTLNYDGDEDWSCDSVVTDQQSGSVQSFIEKEGKWFNYIKGGAGVDTKAFNFQGIGSGSNITYDIQ